MKFLVLVNFISFFQHRKATTNKIYSRNELSVMNILKNYIQQHVCGAWLCMKERKERDKSSSSINLILYGFMEGIFLVVCSMFMVL